MAHSAATSEATACPSGHRAYGSQALAENAATLHRWAFTRCPAYEAFPCGDHWHVGHPTRDARVTCHHHPAHRKVRRRNGY